MDNVIQTESLTFQYSNSVKVLDNISITVPKGSIYGFLGPNGAGKSTTMSLITGLIADEKESIKLFGKSLSEQLPFVFSKIGALIESPALYLHLTGYENLKYVAKLKDVKEGRIYEVLDLVDLTRDSKRKAKEYSLGMKQRLAIGMALLSEPELLLLDEPVNGLDPSGMVDVRELLVRLNKEQGVTIFVSSHLLSEIEKMCTHIGIIHRGKLKFEGTMKELSEKSAHCKIQITMNNAQHWKEKLNKDYKLIQNLTDNQITVQLENRDAVPDFVKSIVNQGGEIYEINILDGLEESFMQMINNN